MAHAGCSSDSIAAQSPPTQKETAQKTIQANKEHQHALKVYTERLEAELATVDKLLDAVEADPDEEPEVNTGGYVLIPGSVKPAGFLNPGDFLAEDSPFREESTRRVRYISSTACHSMKPKELDALTEAVKTENYRRLALDAQRRGQHSFVDVADQPPDYLELNKEGLDWDRIAEKVSSVSMTTRTARECEIRWLGDQHPGFNHDPWQPDELTQLKALIAANKDSQVDWTEIAKKLETNRTPLDCMKHGTVRKIHQWTPESDERLLAAIKYRGTDNWPLVAQYVSEDATPQQCACRWQRTLDPALRRGAWSPEEDARLRLAVEAFGTSWLDVASVIPGRNNDQCRDRWLDKLNPALNKGRWSDEEDRALLATIDALGTSSWKNISARLGTGRADSMCRSRFETLKRRKRPPSKKKPMIPTFAVDSQPAIDHSKISGPSSARGSYTSDYTVGYHEQPTQLTATFAVDRTADLEIMFLAPIIDSHPDMHREGQKAATSLAKRQMKDIAQNQGAAPKQKRKKSDVEDAAEASAAPKRRRPAPRPRRRVVDEEPGGSGAAAALAPAGGEQQNVGTVPD
ncbi:hypothetical protein BJ138DRAFT_1052189 [Hygrophoropsis aurantiaca]|uniref:Uncharacterized protein n=1 Tax=Hygrophoropsis aurantiaca TaxID=72124 RepID=A0ACB8AUV9_9AGAM|nr:hypothetical protein BJ138DRAFT_1052189 [Hygrophoropsis aurantiaca]